MTRPKAAAIVPVEVFEEQQQIAPVWILLEHAACAIHRPAAVFDNIAALERAPNVGALSWSF